jgi:uncharacterized protein YdaL
MGMTKRVMLRELFTILLFAGLIIAPAAADKPDKPGPHPPDANTSDDPHRGPKGPAGFESPQGVREGSGAFLLGNANTLVLYDSTGPYGWLGEMYGTMVANLVSHFGAWRAHPVGAYSAGEINGYTAVVYVGSTYDEPLPLVFLDDVARTAKPVIWAYDNIWQLTNRVANFQSTYGWTWKGFDYSSVPGVIYKSIGLKRYAANGAGIMDYSAVAAPASVLAWAQRATGAAFPWAIRSKNLTYIGEIPLAYIGEGDRYLAFCDLLFDALAPQTPERHRALVRLEDISAESDPVQLMAVADYLSARGVPFSFGVIPHFKDPLGIQNGTPQDIALKNKPALIAALQYMQDKGGFIVDHGWTHQYLNVRNPYNAVTGDDFEFYRVTENADHTLNYVGAVPEDSPAWMNGRLDGAMMEFKAAKLTPEIFEVPHYAASAVDYMTIASRFGVRYERSLYFRGLLSKNPVDASHLVGQFFPFVVRDVYGSFVLPENLGSVELVQFFIFPTRFPADIIQDARRTLVVRDGIASFYFHPFLDVSYLAQTVEGLQALGYTFVSPATPLTGVLDLGPDAGGGDGDQSHNDNEGSKDQGKDKDKDKGDKG